jgi:DNA-binding MarR family transcriptional regulator
MIEEDKNSIDETIENLISIYPMLSKSLGKSIRNKTNQTPGSLFLLGVLAHHGILSMTEIGCHLSIPKPHVTSLIDKLISENLVERLDDPTDRRIVKIKITEKGIEEFNSVKLEVTQNLRQKLQLLEADKIQILSEASGHVKDILRLLVITQHPSSIGCASK